MSETIDSPKAYLAKLNPALFWDVAFSNLDAERSKRLIIERVFTRGDLDELRATIAWYGKDVIVDVLTNLNYLDPKTLNFASLIFEIPRDQFKCYTTKPSKVIHWNS